MNTPLLSSPLLLLTVFLSGALALAVHDLRTLSVPVWLLTAVLVFWAAVSWLRGSDPTVVALVASLVLLLGAIFLRLAPDALGEADVVVMAGMATLFDFWQLIFAIGGACLAGLASVLLALRRGESALAAPVPFLPCLVVGGVAVLGGAW